MTEEISKSTNINDYEILIRKRGEGQYASYCPQLNYMLTGNEHEQVYGLMVDHINKHIDNINSSK